ncbi:hypothetical protein HanIR_Chr07g0305511 [Helianthus annuus]|nr:hypothetical protein HanIR_Chr07g0305511 [Helianthus annuus]
MEVLYATTLSTWIFRHCGGAGAGGGGWWISFWRVKLKWFYF